MGASPWVVATLIALFFAGQVLTELSLENVFTNFENKPDGVAIILAIFQYFGCMFFPMLVSLCSPKPSDYDEVPAEDTSDDATRGGDVEQDKPAEDTVEDHVVWSIVRKDSFAGGIVRGFLVDWQPFILLSFLVFLATVVANISVLYVRYPIKVVFKSSKLIPTMIVSGLMGNSRKFKTSEYISAIMLCLGAAGFALFGNQPQEQDEEFNSDEAELESMSGNAVFNTVFGVSLLLVAVFSDSFVANIQQNLMANGCTPEKMMIRVNVIGLVFSFGYALVSGILIDYIEYVAQEPWIVVYFFAIAVLLGIGIWCYTKLIETSGSVLTVAIATLRKIVTILLSYLVFPKPFDEKQVVASVLVLGGMGLQVYSKVMKK